MYFKCIIKVHRSVDWPWWAGRWPYNCCISCGGIELDDLYCSSWIPSFTPFLYLGIDLLWRLRKDIGTVPDHHTMGGSNRPPSGRFSAKGAYRVTSFDHLVLGLLPWHAPETLCPQLLHRQWRQRTWSTPSQCPKRPNSSRDENWKPLWRRSRPDFPRIDPRNLFGSIKSVQLPPRRSDEMTATLQPLAQGSWCHVPTAHPGQPWASVCFSTLNQP